jgi:hypothetical protein
LPLKDELNLRYGKNAKNFQEKYLVAFELIVNTNQSQIIAFYDANSSTTNDTKHFAINLASNLILRLNGKKNTRIETSLYPLLVESQPQYIATLFIDTHVAASFGKMFAFLFPLGLLILTTIFIMSPMEERKDKVRKNTGFYVHFTFISFFQNRENCSS